MLFQLLDDSYACMLTKEYVKGLKYISAVVDNKNQIKNNNNNNYKATVEFCMDWAIVDSGPHPCLIA